MKEKKKGKSILLRCVLLVFAVYLIVSMLQVQVQLTDQKKELAALELEVAQQQVENKELERRLETGEDKDKLERDAKEILDFFSENERVFRDTSGT